MAQYQIKCDTLENFITTCAKLVRESICFTADTETLTINMTGGY